MILAAPSQLSCSSRHWRWHVGQLRADGGGHCFAVSAAGELADRSVRLNATAARTSQPEFAMSLSAAGAPSVLF